VRPPYADFPTPGRGTLVTNAPTTIEGLCAQQLRIAIGALTQIGRTWVPLLQAETSRHRAADPAAILDARSALNRAEIAFAQATMLHVSVRSPEIDRLWTIASDERAAVKPRIVALLDEQTYLAVAPPAPAPAPAPSVAQTAPPAAPAPGLTPTPAAAPAGAPAAAHAGKLAPPPAATTPAPAAKQPDGPSVNPAPSYAPTWEDIAKAAAGDAAALAALDVTWIDGLDGYFISSIEGAFTKDATEAAFAAEAKANGGLAKIDRDHQHDSSALRQETTKQHKAAKADSSAKAIEADPARVTQQAALDQAHDTARATALHDLRDKFDARKQRGGHAKDVAAPPKEGVTREEARLLARANFVSWGAHALGSVAALKAHFRAMRTVSKIKDRKYPLWLWGPAATRLEQAWDWFEKTYPGNTFFQTDVGFGLRGVHHEEHPLSYLGHALGFSVDFRAYDNPSFLKDGAGMYMLRKFGGHEDNGKHVDGKSRMEMPSDMYTTIQDMGRSSERGEDVSKRGDEMLAAAETAYDKMTATSDNFRAAQAKNMDGLRKAKQRWIQVNGPLKASLAAAEAKLKAAQTAAGGKLAKTTPAADRQTAIDQDAGVIGAVKARDEIATEIATARDEVAQTIGTAFKPWVEQLEGEVAATTKGHEAELALAVDLDGAKAMKAQVARAKTRKALVALLDSGTGKLIFDGDKLKQLTEVADLAAAMTRRAAEVYDAKYAAAENGVRNEVIRRLKDPAGVFGGVQYNGRSKTWSSAPRADAPPVMQILELGFARHDELAGPEQVKNPKQVFNREFITTMMRFGWNTGADWGSIDTMHFDFLDGYAAVNSAGFFAKGKFGPNG